MTANLAASSPSSGCSLWTTADMSVCTKVHKPCNFGPTIGRWSATRAGGAGISSLLSFTRSIVSWTESPIEASTTAVGATTSAMPPNTSKIAANLCLPPSLRTSA